CRRPAMRIAPPGLTEGLPLPGHPGRPTVKAVARSGDRATTRNHESPKENQLLHSGFRDSPSASYLLFAPARAGGRHLLLQLVLEHLDRLLQLGVAPLEEVGRRVVHV